MELPRFDSSTGRSKDSDAILIECPCVALIKKFEGSLGSRIGSVGAALSRDIERPAVAEEKGSVSTSCGSGEKTEGSRICGA